MTKHMDINIFNGLNAIYWAIVSKNSSNHCCQKFIGQIVFQTVVAKSLLDHCCKEFVGSLLPKLSWAIVAMSSSSHSWKRFGWGIIGKAVISARWPTVSLRYLRMLILLLCSTHERSSISHITSWI